MERPDHSFFDQAKTPEKETLAQLARSAFQKSVQRVNDWKKQNPGKSFDWSNYKDTYVQHLLRIESLGFHARNGGNSGIVNASSHRWGPSWRMIVSLEKTGVKAWGVYPGGQSGNPGSHYYGNLMSAWEQSKPYRLKFLKQEALTAATLFTTTLNPN